MEQLQENRNQQEAVIELKKYKSFLIWIAIFLFFILFLFTELFYFYPNEIKGDEIANIDNNKIQRNKESINNNLIFPDLKSGDGVINSDNSSSSLNILASAIIIADAKTKQIFYQKNIYQKMPIASLTKLMTAIIILENFNLDDYIKISKEAILADGDAGNFIVGESISIRSLFYALLITSSNDAAMAIAENTPDEFVFKIFGPMDKNLITPEQRVRAFIAMMNKKAQNLNLNSTYFADVAGLSQETHSTVFDLMNLSSYIYQTYPIIFEITKIKEMTIASIDNLFIHKLINTDKLLETMGEIIIGGKTGYLDEAGQCLLILAKLKYRILINIILNSPDRFGEMQKLIELIKVNI